MKSFLFSIVFVFGLFFNGQAVSLEHQENMISADLVDAPRKPKCKDIARIARNNILRVSGAIDLADKVYWWAYWDCVEKGGDMQCDETDGNVVAD